MTYTLEWAKRAKIRRTELSTQRRWESRCGRWALVEVRGAYGRYWLRIRRYVAGECVVGRHKTRRAAEAACG